MCIKIIFLIIDYFERFFNLDLVLYVTESCSHVANNSTAAHRSVFFLLLLARAANLGRDQAISQSMKV